MSKSSLYMVSYKDWFENGELIGTGPHFVVADSPSRAVEVLKKELPEIWHDHFIQQIMNTGPVYLDE